MKISVIITLFSLIVIVRGWWAAAAQPVILGLGAAFAVVDLDAQENLFIKLPNWDELEKMGKQIGKDLKSAGEELISEGKDMLWEGKKKVEGWIEDVLGTESKKEKLRPIRDDPYVSGDKKKDENSKFEAE